LKDLLLRFLAASLPTATVFLFTAAFVLPSSHLFVVSLILVPVMLDVASHLFVASLFLEIADWWTERNDCAQSSGWLAVHRYLKRDQVLPRDCKHKQIASQYRDHTLKGKMPVINRQMGVRCRGLLNSREPSAAARAKFSNAKDTFILHIVFVCLITSIAVVAKFRKAMVIWNEP